jgi:hypothetical protein
MDTKTVLAYLALAYLIASGVYLCASACCLDTPFRKSLTAQQISIKQYSSSVRRKVFLFGLVLAVGILYLWKPF